MAPSTWLSDLLDTNNQRKNDQNWYRQYPEFTMQLIPKHSRLGFKFDCQVASLSRDIRRL